MHPHLRLFVAALVMTAALACSDHGDPEGPCFAPGERCESTACSQGAFCLSDAGPPTCVAARQNGSACLRDAECIGSCVAGLCAGSPRPCPRF